MRSWLFVALLLAVIGCAKRSPATSAGYAAPAYDRVEADDGDYAAEEWSADEAARVTAGGLSRGRPPQASVQPVEPSARMVHYDGYVRMRVTRPAEALDRVAALAVDAGGRVDRLADAEAVVRVPVDRFDEVWQAVLELGDVLTQQVRADDVTEQFRATDLRVKTLRTMHQRLVRLLSRARTEEQKLSLLRQITRVTEELDRTESQLRVLRDLATMSAITVNVESRELGPRPDTLYLSGFEWIRPLSPFNRAVFADTKRIELSTPDEMVVLAPRGPYIARGPDQTVLWTMRVDNNPRGDADFWRSAVLEVLSDDFDNVTSSETGDWSCASFDEPGADEPYRWQVCLQTMGRHVHVMQAFYPGSAQVERFGERIERALLGGGAS